MPQMTIRIGRRHGPNPLVHAFDLVREPDGRILIQNEDIAPTPAERRAIFDVLGHAVRALSGSGRTEDGHFIDALTDLAPGTEEHFANAVRFLPLPYFAMP